MRTVPWSLCILVLASASAPSHQPGDSPPAVKSPEFHKLRYDDDFSYLQHPANRSDPWDPIKFLPLDDQKDVYLSFGGEARWRFEFYRNYRWNPDAADQDGYLLQRYLLHADLHAGEAVRAFAQLQTSLEDWREDGPRPTDEDRTDIHQLFGDLRHWNGSASDSLTIRVGRQEMLYGSQRLVSVRESPNVRRSFDAVRLLTRADAWRIDAFIARPVEDDQGAFDDSGDGHINFWGVYATHPLPFTDVAGVDLYYLGLRRPDAEFVQGTASELRHSFGTRIFGEHEGWDYNTEGVLQIGTFGEGDILAWTLASDTGYTFRGAAFTPRCGLRADIISGDLHEGDNRLGTFNPLFPRGAYFGESSLIGPANILDLHPTLELHLHDHLKLSADWDIFWRYSESDGLYDNGGNVLRTPSGSQARFVGHQPSLSLEWELGAHTTLNAAYSHFFAGDFIKQSGTGDDVDCVALWLIYRF